MWVDTVLKEAADFSQTMRRKLFDVCVMTELGIISTYSNNLVILLTLQKASQRWMCLTGKRNRGRIGACRKIMQKSWNLNVSDLHSIVLTYYGHWSSDLITQLNRSRISKYNTENWWFRTNSNPTWESLIRLHP